jgi:hypothetical protein
MIRNLVNQSNTYYDNFHSEPEAINIIGIVHPHEGVIMEVAFVLCILGSFFLVALLMLALAVRIVPQDKRLSVYRLGQYLGDKGPGIVILIPFIDRGVLTELNGPEKVPSQQKE